MAEIRFYRLILSQENFLSFLVQYGLIISAEKANEQGLECRNQNCDNPRNGFIQSNRKRNINERNSERLLEEGQNVITIPTLRCRSCKTYLSPRTNGFLSYFDRMGRANSKLSPEKIVQIIFHWASFREIAHSINLLDVSEPILIDWHNHCRHVCMQSNIRHFNNRKIGGGPNTFFVDGKPTIVVQIDETLLRGKRKYNRGRMLAGDENILQEDRETFRELYEGENINENRNHGMRIEGPWVFGMVECTLDENGSYRSGECRLFYVEDRKAETLLPIIRNNTEIGSVVWSDDWASYRQLGNEDGLIHGVVNHSNEFVSDTGVNTQNIEREWAKLKDKILKKMKCTSKQLFESHLQEYMWRSRQPKDIFIMFINFLREAGEIYPITF